jgi:hypothetical protein
MTESVVTIAHEDQVTLPTTTRMMVETGDWARIRRSVEKLGDSAFDRAATLGGILVGAAIALIGIAASIETGSTKPGPGLLTGLWVAFGFCTFFALILLGMGFSEKRRYRTSNRAICEDMDDVATRANHPGLGVPSPRLALGIKRRLARLWSAAGLRRDPVGGAEFDFVAAEDRGVATARGHGVVIAPEQRRERVRLRRR